MFTLFKTVSKGVAALAVTAAFILVPGQLRADLEGDTVLGTLNSGPTNINFFDMNLGTNPVPAVVIVPRPAYFSTGLGVDVVGGIGSDVIQLTMTNNNPFPVVVPNLDFLFEDLEWTNQPGFVQDVSFVLQNNSLVPDTIQWSHIGSVSEIFIGFNGPINFNAGQEYRARFEILAVHVPEPQTYLLMGSLLGVALFATRRKRQSTNHVS